MSEQQSSNGGNGVNSGTAEEEKKRLSKILKEREIERSENIRRALESAPALYM